MKKNILLVLLPLALGALAGCQAKPATSDGSKASDPSQTTPQSSIPSETSSDVTPSSTDPVTPSSTDPTPSSSDPAGGDDYFIKTPTEIRFLNTLSYGTQIDNMIESFKKIEPNVTVVNEKISGSYDAIQSQTVSDFGTGEYADLVLCYPDHVVNYQKYGKAVKLDAYIDNEDYGLSEDDLEDIVPNFWNECSAYPVKGMWSLPWCNSTEAMYYDEAKLIGLDLSKYDASINKGASLTKAYIESLTWDELFDHLAPALLQYNNDPDNPKKGTLLDTSGDYSVVGYDSDDNLFITLAEQYDYGYTDVDKTTGKGEILWNNENMKSLMKKFKAAKDAHLFTTQGVYGNYTNYLFTAGKSLFSIGSTGGVKYQFDANNPTNVGVAPIPQKTQGANIMIKQGPGLCILNHGKDEAGTNRKLASWLFYKHLISAKNDQYWATETGYMPNLISSYASEAYAEYADYTAQPDKSIERLTAYAANYSMNVRYGLFLNPAFQGSSTSRNQVKALLTNCLKSSSLDTEIDGLFKTAYDNTMKEMGEE